VSTSPECAAWPLRGGPSSSGKHARGGPPVDDRGCNDRDKRERRAARDCRGTRAAASGAVSVGEKATRAFSLAAVHAR